MTASMTTAALLEKLEEHYRPAGSMTPNGDGHALLREVAAPNSSRRCDLLAMGIWRSRGTEIDVHEVKTSRSDWQRELDKPDKAEAWWPYCDRFWIVSPGPEITPPDTLPTGWGLMVPNPRGRRFKVLVKPAKHTARVDRALLLTMVNRSENLRVAHAYRMQSEHADALDRQARTLKVDRARGEIPPEMQKRLRVLEELEATLGHELTSGTFKRPGMLNAADTGAALAAYVTGHIDLTRLEGSVRRAAEGLISNQRYFAERARDILKELNAGQDANRSEAV
jgi:hypothetical protein